MKNTKSAASNQLSDEELMAVAGGSKRIEQDHETERELRRAQPKIPSNCIQVNEGLLCVHEILHGNPKPTHKRGR